MSRIFDASTKQKDGRKETWEGFQMKIYCDGIFGYTQAGKPVQRYILEGSGLRMSVLTYGGTIQNL